MTDPSGLCWYWDFNSGRVKHDRSDIDTGLCQPFSEFIDQQGINYLPSNTSPDNFLDALSPEHREIFLSVRSCPYSGSGYTPSDYWMVIKYSASSKWKSYETSSTGVEYKLIIGFGGGGSYSCDNSSGECSLSGQLELGEGGSLDGMKVALGIGVGAEYNLYQGTFNWGGYADLGHCGVYASSTKISLSCSEPLTGQTTEQGWWRLKYREYVALVSRSTITKYGGFIDFAKKRIVPSEYDKSQIRYDIWATHSDKEPLLFQYGNNNGKNAHYDLIEFP